MPPSRGLLAPGSLLSQGREPAASGIQPSRATSAIQSNQISSTAATGVRAAQSKGVEELKRKIFQNNASTGSYSNGSIPSSHRMTDLAGQLKNARVPAPARVAKSKANEKLGGDRLNGIDEEEGDDTAPPKAKPSKKKSSVRDPKPGYCENCRDKYDDFEDVSVSF
jgi:regulatory subunit for Cdc7p protein kinase